MSFFKSVADIDQIIADLPPVDGPRKIGWPPAKAN